MAPPKHEVYVIDDDPQMRKALERLIAAAGYDVSTFSSASEFLAWWSPAKRGCLVLDIRLPDADGMELYRRLKERDPCVSVVFVTGFGDIPTSVEAIKSGAIDFLQKPVDGDTLMRAIENALVEARSRRLERQRMRGLTRRYDSLTPREREVLHHVVAGRLNKQIARDLDISVKTVKVHRARAMAKMGARRVAHLVQLANRLGLGANDEAVTPPHPAGSESGDDSRRGRWRLPVPRLRSAAPTAPGPLPGAPPPDPATPSS